MIKFCRKPSQGLLSLLMERFIELNGSQPTGAILQYLVYLSREAGVPWGYSFDLLYYGPYSKELEYDLELLQADGVFKETEEGFSPTQNYSLLINNFKTEIDRSRNIIYKILDVFKGLDIKFMRLISSVYYIYISRKKSRNGAFKEKEVIKEIVTLKKNYFDKQEIEKSFFSLRQAALI